MDITNLLMNISRILYLKVLYFFNFFKIKKADLKDFHEIESIKNLEIIKDSAMKLLVYEISIARGIQYDIDRMSKVEKQNKINFL